MNKTIRIGQGRLLSMPIRLVLTLGTMAAIIALLEFAQPEDKSALVPIIILCTLVPAYWTSRKVIEVHEKSHVAVSYWWVMGSKFRSRQLGKVHGLQVNALPDDYSSLTLVFDTAPITVVRSIPDERASGILERFKAIGVPLSETKNPE